MKKWYFITYQRTSNGISLFNNAVLEFENNIDLKKAYEDISIGKDGYIVITNFIEISYETFKSFER